VRDDRVVARLRDVRLGSGPVRLGRLEVEASPTLVDASVSPALRLHVPRLGLVVEDAVFGGAGAARIHIAATLPHDGRLDAEGTMRPAPAKLALDVRAHDVDLTLLSPYLLSDAPVTLDRGRLGAGLTVGWDDGWHADGQLVARDVTLLRRGESELWLHHPSLTSTIRGLTVRDGQLSVERLTIEGAPTIVDATASPPQRFNFRGLSLTVDDLTWPGRRPARLQGRAALADGSRGELTGVLDTATLGVDTQVHFENVDVRRAGAYVPPALPLVVDRGRAEATVRVRHRRGAGVRLDATGAIHDLALTVGVNPRVHVGDPRVDITLDDLALRDGTVSLAAATVDGAPVLGRTGETGSALSRLHAAVDNVRWPVGPDADWQLVAEPAAGGRLTAHGTFTPATRALRAAVEANDVAVGPLTVFLPIDAPVSGRLDGRARASTSGPDAAKLDGQLTLRALAIGPPDAAPVRIETITATGITLRGGELAVARLGIERPSVLVERKDDGSFPLRAMLTSAASPARSPDDRASHPQPDGDPAAAPAPPFAIDELVVREGNVRFIDHATTPFYSEEVRRLAVTVRGLTSADEARATIGIQGIVGVDAALDLEGQVAPFATPLYLDVAGELRGFALRRTNPYLRRFLDWIARRGELATRVHYHVEGGRLTATNEIVVERLDLERVEGDARTERLVGLPLGLIVALLKDARGKIHVTVPVSGSLRSPEFSFGDAIRTAFRNVVTRLVTGPFRAIGSVFRRHGSVAEVGIDPVTFEPGRSTLTPEAAAHLQRVADFLRARPYVGLTLRPVMTNDDLYALRIADVTARIQQLQRDEDVADFAEAAHRLWRRTRGNEPVGDTPEIVRRLAEVERIGPELERTLAERRVGVTRTYLAESAGIERDRLAEASGPPVADGGDGRVEFSLRKESP
jgi:hypothetical protein